MATKFTDNALTTLGASIANNSTILTVPAGKGNNFPAVTGGNPNADHFVITMENSAGQREHIRVNHRAAGSDTLGSAQFPCERGYLGSLALAWTAGDSVDLRLPAGLLDTLLNAGSSLQSHIEGAAAHQASSIAVQAFGALAPGNAQAAFEAMLAKPVVQPILNNKVLALADIGTLKHIVAASDLTLPSTASVANGDSIGFKSSTEQRVRLLRTGSADTIDGEVEYQIPSYSFVQVTKLATGVWAITVKPDVWVGKVALSASNKLPRGWTWADEKLLNRVAHGGLFYAVGTTYGAGDASTTFGKPDYRGRTPFGVDNQGGAAAGRVTSASGIVGNALGAVGGSQLAQRHNHGVTDPGHSHVYNHPSDPVQKPTSGGSAPFTNVAAVSTGVSVTNISIQNAHSGESENMPPAIMQHYIVKT